MTPITTTKDKYSEKWIAWYLPSDKIANIESEEQAKSFWKCTNNFYLIGVGDTEKQAVANLKKQIAEFTIWWCVNYSELDINGINSNLPEYRNAIFEFNTRNFF
jgi:hypothetical protein